MEPDATSIPVAEVQSLPRWRVRRTARQRGAWSGWLFALPALVMYAVFYLWPILTALKLSMYNWDGIGPMTWAGLDNYRAVFSDTELRSSLFHAFYLLIFFCFLPVIFGLISAAVIREIKGKALGATARMTMFLPQIIPGAAAAVAWTWMYSSNGVVNQVLSGIGLGSLTRPWLSDFTWALTAVGFIGTWLLTGFCTLLLLSGIGKIDQSIYEAARLDGAGSIAQFRAVTLPGLRQEIGVCVTFTVIAALASFDVVFLATQGGPGYQTMVPGVEVYQNAFVLNKLGLASAVAVVLTGIVLVVIVPLQRIFRES